jgi:hypothetical protein
MGHEPQARFELGGRLADGVPRFREPAGSQQIGRPLVRQAAFDEVMGDYLGLTHDGLRPQPLDRLRDARVQLLAARLE